MDFDFVASTGLLQETSKMEEDIGCCVLICSLALADDTCAFCVRCVQYICFQTPVENDVIQFKGFWSYPPTIIS
eukprot:scaffold10789_cov236-Chaetoceros_neogracile.AAC.2